MHQQTTLSIGSLLLVGAKANTPSPNLESEPSSADGLLSRAKTLYAYAVFSLPLIIVLASFIRDRGQILSNVSLWLFLASFVLTIFRTNVGLLTTALLLTVSPALDVQLNSVLGTRLHAFNDPGVDACAGFLLGWVVTGKLPTIKSVLQRFPSWPLLLFHAWVAVSAGIVIARNIWQSGSEFSARGLLYNVYLVRGISWHDDYYPLFDLLAYTIALALLLSVWVQMRERGEHLLQKVVGAVFLGTYLNLAFGLWQKSSGRGWTNGLIADSMNAFLPDLHSFAALMLLSFLLGYGLLVSRLAPTTTKILVVLVMLLSCVGLYYSGSRAALFLLCLLLAAWGLRNAFQRKGLRRMLALLGLTVLLIGIDLTLRQGYRGLSYSSLRVVTDGLSFATFNEAFSRRPEMWHAALLMYAEFPWFGLGQGSFYRLSALPGFSVSPYLVSAGGENLHNYFLQTFVELGPVGLLLVLLCCVPIFRQRANNFNLLSFYALLAIVIGNVFAHALLEREMLMLAAVFLGTYFAESESRSVPVSDAREHRGPVLAAQWGFVAFVVLAAIEVAHSFFRFPFHFGQRCFEPFPIAQDGWTSGLLRQPIPDAATHVDLGFAVDRPDVPRRPLSVEVAVANAGGIVLWSRLFDVREPAVSPIRLAIDLPEQARNSDSYLTVKTSNCLLPLNLGLTYDPRRLGVRIEQLRFDSKSRQALQ